MTHMYGGKKEHMAPIIDVLIKDGKIVASYTQALVTACRLQCRGGNHLLKIHKFIEFANKYPDSTCKKCKAKADKLIAKVNKLKAECKKSRGIEVGDRIKLPVDDGKYGKGYLVVKEIDTKKGNIKFNHVVDGITVMGGIWNTVDNIDTMIEEGRCWRV